MATAASLFLVLDGPDGAGKSTQAARLAERLRAAGRDVLQVREPGGTAAGERIRAVLLDPAIGELDPVTELLLYQASRRRLVLERIVPALAAGRTVVCDRWHTATTVYQGIAGGVELPLIRMTTKAATGGLEPRRSILLDVPEGVAIQRMARPLDRMEDKGAAFRARVRAGFRDLFDGDPDRFRVVDASRDVDAVAESVWDAVRDLV